MTEMITQASDVIPPLDGHDRKTVRAAGLRLSIGTLSDIELKEHRRIASAHNASTGHCVDAAAALACGLEMKRRSMMPMGENPGLTPRQIEATMKPGCTKPGDVERLYAARDAFITQMQLRGEVNTKDLKELDRLGRCTVAGECWGICTPEVQKSLRNDAHHSVRSVAEISFKNSLLSQPVGQLAK